MKKSKSVNRINFQKDVNYRQTANTKKNRICFSQDNKGNIISKSYSKKKNTEKYIELSVYPNYKIENNQIDLTSILPKKKIYEKLIKFEYCETLNNKENIKQIGESFKGVWQFVSIILCYEKQKLSKIETSFGSFTWVEYFGKEFGITNLHCLNYIDENWENFYFVSFSEKSIEQILKELIKSEMFLNEIKNERDSFMVVEIFKEYFMKMHKIFFELVSVDLNFLDIRENRLNNKFEQRKNYFKDPILNMKPSPAFDFSIIVLSKKIEEKLKNEGVLKPLRICEKFDENDLVYLIGFSSIRGSINFAEDEEYSETYKEILNNLKNNKNPQDLQNLKKLKNLEIPMELLLNPEKSLNLCKILKYNNGIICFQGSTNYGSSGGALLNEKGELIGINFGNYFDNEQEEEIPENLDKFNYDFVSNESKENYISMKNFNLAINIAHPILIEYLQPNKITTKKRKMVKSKPKRTKNKIKFN